MFTWQQGTDWALSNFGLAMYALAVVMMILHKITFGWRTSMYEIIFRWFVLFPVGFTALYAFVMHAFFPDLAAGTIGWKDSPFQYEVAIANLGFGLIAALSFKASYGFRLAAVIGVTCWLWGDAVGHVFQMIQHHDYAPGNVGSWFWLDVFMPFILIICIYHLKPETATTYQNQTK